MIPTKKNIIDTFQNNIEKIVDKWGFQDATKYKKIEEVKLWLSNFKPYEIPIIFNLLEYIYLINEEKIKQLLDDVAFTILNDVDKNLTNIKILSLEDDRSSSGGRFLYYLKKILGQSECFNYKNYTELEKARYLILIDDIIGSGKQATTLLKKWQKINKNCLYYSLIGLEKGVDYIKSQTKINAFAAEMLDESCKIFSKESTIPNKEECKKIAEEYGKKLYYKYDENKQHPLGYDDSQLLVCFKNDCPNNTLPIIWAGAKSELKKLENTIWHPLFERLYVPKSSPDEQIIKTEGLPEINNINFFRKNNLTERSKKIVDRLAHYFSLNNEKDFSNLKIPLLKAWSGEGKTTIAIEYIYQYGSLFDAIFWIDANLSIEEQFILISTHQLNTLEFKDSNIKIQEVKKYINTHKVLLIFDNIIDISKCLHFFPKNGKSRIIAITTNFNLKDTSLFEDIVIPELNIKDALKILLHDIHLPKESQTVAKEIAKILGKNSFALELTNSYLKEYSDISIETLYSEYQNNILKFEKSQNKAKNTISIHQSNSIHLLIENRIHLLNENEHLDVICKQILNFIACFCEAKEELDFNTLKELIGFSNKKTCDIIKFNKIKNRLTELGFIQFTKEKINVHTLISEYLKNEYIKLEFLIKIVSYKISNAKNCIECMIDYRLWLQFPLEIISTYFNIIENKFKNFQSHQIRTLIDLTINYAEILYFYNLNEKCIMFLDKANKLCLLDNEYHEYKYRESYIFYRKTLALHRLEKEDEAFINYQNLLYTDSVLSPKDSIDCFIYLGHICRKRKNKIEALKYYQEALKLSKEYYKAKIITKFESIEFKLRVLLFHKSLYHEFSATKDYNQIVKVINKTILELMKFFPEEYKKMEEENPYKFPYKIFQQLSQPNICLPENTILHIRLIKSLSKHKLKMLQS